MLGGVTRHMVPHLPGVPHLHVNGPLNKFSPVLLQETYRGYKWESEFWYYGFKG